MVLQREIGITPQTGIDNGHALFIARLRPVPPKLLHHAQRNHRDSAVGHFTGVQTIDDYALNGDASSCGGLTLSSLNITARTSRLERDSRRDPRFSLRIAERPTRRLLNSAHRLLDG